MSGNISSRRIDHLVLPSRRIEELVSFYKRLGFLVGARNVHPWGTENHIVQFDQSFLELITVGDNIKPPPHTDRHFSFGAHVQNWLRTKDGGMSMLVLSSVDAKSDAHRFKKANIGDFEPFFFQRKGKRPDGSETEVAFTLAFAQATAMPQLSFFVCQQHFPENFWNPAMQIHDNGVLGIQAVVIRHEKPQECLEFLARFSEGIAQNDTDYGFSVQTQKGKLAVSNSAELRNQFGDDPLYSQIENGSFAALIFAVHDFAGLIQSLQKNAVVYQRREQRIIIPSTEAFGIVLVFELGEAP